MIYYTIQPAPHVDHITEDGTELTKLPYPYHTDQDGAIQRQDFWQGNPLRVVGFQKDLSVQQVDLWWKDALKDPQQAVGMYLVTQDKDGNCSSHNTAVESITPVVGAEQGQNRATGSQEGEA
jgi:hypothetical protein